ncbi:hypothetical protein IFR04_015225, partial [Cadophora malorum]
MSDYMRPVAPVPRVVPRTARTYREPTVDDDGTEDEEVAPKSTHTNDLLYPRRRPANNRFRRSRISPTQRQAFDPLTNTPNMSSQTRIQFQASDVLRQLEPLPSGPFGPEHQLVIARNMALIQGVTADSREERKEAERKRREIVTRAKKALRIREGLVGMEVDDEDEEADDGESWTPSSSEDGSGSPLNGRNSNRPESRKRRHSDPDVDDKKQIKKARRFANPSLQIQQPLDITTLCPLPLRMTYPAHPSTDRPDTWFTSNFASLYRQIETFCSTYYSLHSIPLTDEPWSKCKMTPEFIKWTEMVAEPEPRMGCWDELLRDTGMRKWFVMAVVMYDVRPGDIWQPDDMHCLEQAAAFVGSKEVIVEDYRRERHNIKFARAEAEEYMKSLAPPSIHLHPHTQKSKKENAWNGSEESDDEDEDQDEEVREVREVRGTRAYRRAKANFEKLDAMYADKLANPPSRTHRALIKLSVWPVIRRYTPGSAAEDSEPNKPLHEKDGFRIFLIAKAGVVA